MKTSRDAGLLLRPAFAIAALAVAPLMVQGVAPTWWATHHVYQQDNGTPVPATDHAVANQGQLKHVAVAAYAHLVEALAPHGRKVWEKWDGSTSIAGEDLCALIEQWVELDRGAGTGNTGRVLRMELVDGQPPPNPTYSVNGTGPMKRTAASLTHNDFSAITQGQVKAVGKPFYRRLDEIYRIQNGTVQLPLPTPWRGGVPWTDDDDPLTTADTEDDESYAHANIGQIKAVFSFDLNGDSNVDGTTDVESIVGGLDPFGPADSDGDGLTNAEEQNLGTNPNVKDNPAVELSVVGFVRP
jgi:hypothetical protein